MKKKLWRLIKEALRLTLVLFFLLAGTPIMANHSAANITPQLAQSARLEMDVGFDDLLYSTYLGGNGTETVTAVAVGDSGHIYIVGSTNSSDFPTTPLAYQKVLLGSNRDAFVARLDPSSSTPVYITLLGGTGTDEAFGLAVDSNGAAYVTGWTNHNSFPRTPGVLDNTGGGLWEGFVTKISPDGSQLEYSTFLGGNGTDKPKDIKVDALGVATVVGYTMSSEFPMPADAIDATSGTSNLSNINSTTANQDVFVVRINPTATALEFGILLGGSGVDDGFAVDQGGDGHIAVAGRTWSSDFPVTVGAFDTEYSGPGDGFVVVLNPVDSALVYATYLHQSTIHSLAVDGTGAAFVAGNTSSVDFPTTPGAFDTSYGGGMCGPAYSPYRCKDGFVVKFSADGSTLDYSTFLGGDRDDRAYGIALGPYSTAYVTGYARSADFPSTLNAYDPTFNGHFSHLCEDGDVCPDVFLVRLTPSGADLTYGSFVGAIGEEWGAAIALRPDGDVVVAGVAEADFPTTPGAYDQTHNGGKDAFALALAPSLQFTYVYLPFIQQSDTTP